MLVVHIAAVLVVRIAAVLVVRIAAVLVVHIAAADTAPAAAVAHQQASDCQRSPGKPWKDSDGSGRCGPRREA